MPVLIFLREKLWTRTYSIGDQVPTCPVFTRAKIKSRFGILVNLPSQYTVSMSKAVLFQAILFSISTPFRCCHSVSVWTWERWQWRGTLHFPNLHHYWNLTMRLLSVIYKTLFGGVLHLCREAVMYSTVPTDRGMKIKIIYDFWLVLELAIFNLSITLKLKREHI